MHPCYPIWMDTHDDINRLLGQIFMVGIPLPILDEETRKFLQDLRPGGVILFRRNYKDVETLALLCHELHGLDPANPPLIAIDHEGGRVHRLNAPFTHFPPALQLTQNGSPNSIDLAYLMGQAMGRELRAVGIDINFAPVLDVFSNPDNTVIGDRAYSSDPYKAAALGCALARGLRLGGVIPCGKHFPGHGATRIDSHQDLPTDERSRASFEQMDLLPFRQACAERIEMLMTAHVLYPAFDPDLPATLSPTIIGGLLRQQLGFTGVVVSDDLEMGAIVRRGSVEKAAVGSLAAGADMLLVCQRPALAIQARNACLQALETGRIPEQRLAAAAQRIATLQTKKRLEQPASREIIGAEEHQLLTAEIQRAVM